MNVVGCLQLLWMLIFGWFNTILWFHLLKESLYFTVMCLNWDARSVFYDIFAISNDWRVSWACSWFNITFITELWCYFFEALPLFGWACSIAQWWFVMIGNTPLWYVTVHFPNTRYMPHIFWSCNIFWVLMLWCYLLVENLVFYLLDGVNWKSFFGHVQFFIWLIYWGFLFFFKSVILLYISRTRLPNVILSMHEKYDMESDYILRLLEAWWNPY